MGKRIIQQARGKGSLTYRVNKKAFSKKVGYKIIAEKEGTIISLLHSAAHSAPLVKIRFGNNEFYNVAFNGVVEGQKVYFGGEVKPGNIMALKDIPVGTRIFNIERNPGDGGKMIRTAGSSAFVERVYDGKVGIRMPNRKEVKLDHLCRATIGEVAGSGRTLKPFVKAGNKFYKMKARNKLWPRTSAVKMNAIDHPFGSGRGKRIKSKTAKRNAPAGKRVGHIRPRRTGKRK